MDGTAPPPPRVVAIGGGHGLARALAALRLLELAPTAVVTVADNGGSSGRLRRELDIIPPGDLRMALLTLARNRELADCFAHRFSRGPLEGHALGNLALVALAEQTDGDFVVALDRLAGLLDCAGRALPATQARVEMRARVAGEQVDGQTQVATAQGRVERVWLEPASPPACPEAATALREADVVVLGPGSLFTSVVATLLVPGLAEALIASPARVVYVANVLTQPGETGGLDAGAHVQGLLDHVPGLHLDVVVCHDGPAPTGSGAPLDHQLNDARVGEVVCADVVARDDEGQPLGAHDPDRLAAVLAPVISARTVG